MGSGGELVEERTGITNTAGTFGGHEDDSNGSDGSLGVPWVAVGPGEVAGLLAEYRRAVEAVEALRAGLLAAGLRPRELPELTPTLDIEGRACVVVGQLPAHAAARIAALLNRAGRAA
ncbi:MAG TPA: hypothetical protein VFP72_21215 [Kineosporiaceae bacterium]|nr:hypothetical protein [Kineosporiaceae bacterium]